MQKTGIEYLTHTWNPIAMRCSPISDGCSRCWHLGTADRLCMNPSLPENERLALSGKGPFIVREREMLAPLRVKKPAVIGVQFMGDFFHEAVPDEFISQAFAMMKRCERMTTRTFQHYDFSHTFLILTKRPQRMLDYIDKNPRIDNNGNLARSLKGVYYGLTVCNQQEADEKIPVFLQVPGKKFLSIEPLLGPIDLGKACAPYSVREWAACGVSVILGGESGPGARPLHPDWVRSVRDQCQSAGVPFFFKGWGMWRPCDDDHEECEGHRSTAMRLNGDIVTDENPIWSDKAFGGPDQGFWRAGAKAGRLLDGREHNELPWVK